MRLRGLLLRRFFSCRGIMAFSQNPNTGLAYSRRFRRLPEGSVDCFKAALCLNAGIRAGADEDNRTETGV